MANVGTSTRERALALLGYGSGAAHVAAACGVTESDISQLVSDPEFAAQVAELRFKNLSKHNDRDSKLDTLEDELIEKLNTLKDLMYRPMEVLKALQVINSAKRRGASSPEMLAGNQKVVTLVMPTVVIQRFQTNINNQVIVAGNQELVTIPSATLLDSVKQKQKERLINGSQRSLPALEAVGAAE